MKNDQLTSIESVRSKADEFKTHVDEHKKEIEYEYKSLMDLIKQSINDVDEKVSEDVKWLNDERNHIQAVYNNKLGSTRSNLEMLGKTVEKLSFSVKSALEESNKVLTVLYFVILLLTFLILVYPDLNLVIKIPIIPLEIPVILLLLNLSVISALLYQFHIYNQLKNKFESNLDEFYNHTNDLQQLKLPEIKNRPPIQEDGQLKNKVSSIKQVTKGVFQTVGDFVPFVDSAYNFMQNKADYKYQVDLFISAVEYYGITNDIEKLNGILHKPDSIIFAQNNKIRDYEQIISEKISYGLKQDNQKVSSKVIMLLYQEHNGIDTSSIFREIKESNQELVQLSDILLHNNRLHTTKLGRYKNKDVITILKTLDSFDLSQINEILFSASRLLSYLNSYKEFLQKNGISVQKIPDLDFVIGEAANHTDDIFETKVIRLSYRLGKETLPKNADLGTLSNAFVRASISLKFHDDIMLREIACKCSGNDESTAIIRSYLDKMKEQDGQSIVYLKDLMDDIELIKKHLMDRNRNDFKFLKEQLKKGTWEDSLASLMMEYIKTLSSEIEDKLSQIDNYKTINNIIKKTFSKIKIGTVDKAIDSQVFGAYIIMGKSKEGRLLKYVDELSIRTSSPDKNKKWEKKTPNEIELIKNNYKVNAVYDFVKFSDSTRIGILPKGKSFLEFKSEFFSDLGSMFNEIDSEEEFKSGLIIQRISPSNYSFGVLDGENLPNNIKIEELDIAEYITKLASGYVSTEEQMAISSLEKDINLFDFVNEKSILELIQQENDDLNDEEIKLLSKNKFKNDLMNQIENEIGNASLYSLAIDLYKEHLEEDQVSQIFTDVIKKYYAETPSLKRKAKTQRPVVLSKRFTTVIKGVGMINDWYSQ
ncbi:hypothetical protein EFE42_03855 [Methanohalophilus sp. RSK]|uniref:hypothetical protein n=1 Tax=Methanohalophilus sp. RSK TaxID=2485783 RepID=UPI000F43D981|nr:hypothetical protein [Methanohalophilus sp. RSK]RNI14520.1 hypothetical protein EFE42_03855 [Methanohalophilus sp. RSK]